MDWLFKGFVVLWRSLVPSIDATPMALYMSRLVTALLMIIIIIGGGSSMALAWGFFPLVFAGFATVSQVQQVADNDRNVGTHIEEQINSVRSDVVSVKALVIGQNIWSDVRDECKLAVDSDGAREQMERRIDWEMQVYQSTTGRAYDRPGCEVFK